MADRTVLVKLAASTAGFRSEIDKAARSTKAFVDGAADGSKRAARGLSEVKGEATALGAVLIAAPVAGAVAWMGFDKQMSKVGAVTGASASQMDKLRKAAVDAGQATVFSASDAAAAQAELAKAGVTTSDILGGALTGSLNLAAAGELDVAEAASIAATTMTQFGLKGADVGHIADLLASAANKAQGEVTDMAAALKYVGPVASQMDIPLEQTVGTIAELASQGILGEQAGTSLRGMLSSLTSPSQVAAKEMAGLGIDVYDATGKFVGFDGVAQQLHDTMGGLTAAERDQAFGRIFGNEQITAARILYAGGAADVQKWTTAVDDAGAAERLASQYLDNLSGDIEQLTGSIETGLIQAGSGANDVLRFMTQRATDTVNAISQMPPGFLAVAGGASFMAGSFLLLAPRIVDTVDALKQMKATSGVGGIGKGLGFTAAIAGAGLLTTEVAAANGELQDMLEAADEIDQAFASGGGDSKLSDLAKQADELAKKIRQSVADPDVWQQMALGWQAAMEILQGDDEGAIERVAQEYADAANRAQESSVTYGKALDYVSTQMGVNRNEAAALMDQAQAAGVVISGSYETQGRAVTTWAATTTQGHGAAQVAMAKTVDAAGAMVDAVLGAMNRLDQRGKERAFQQSIDDATEALKKNKRGLDIHTEAGRANAAALDDIAAKTLDLATSKDKEGNVTITNTKALNAGAIAYATMAMKMGLSKGEAMRLAEKVVGVQLELDKLGRMRVVPKVTVDTTTGMTRAQALKALLDQIKSKSVTIDVYQQVHGSAVVNPDRAEGRVGRAGGGPITGPGTATSDSIPIMASDGEWMIKAAAVDRLEGRFGPGVMHQINSGHLPGYASGGKVTAKERREQRRAAAVQKVTDLKSSRASSIESIASSMTSTFGLGNAFDFGAQARAIDDLAAAEQRLADANQGVADSDRDVFEARRAVNRAGSPKERADAERALTDALEAQAKARAEQASAEGGVTTARTAVAKTAASRENILDSWRGKLEAITQYDANLKKLRKRGFSAHMIAQIAGDPNAAELAAALANASASQVKAFNNIDAQIVEHAGSIARMGGSAQYDPQIRAAQQAAMGLGATAKQVGPLVPAFGPGGSAKVVIHSHVHIGKRQIAESKVALGRRDGGFDWGDG